MIALDFPNAITSEERFYGRWPEVDQIQAMFLNNPRVPVIVIGERRVGKTSIHTIATRRLRNLSEGSFIPLVVEPRGIQSVDQFFEVVLNRLSSCTLSDLHTTGCVGADSRVHLESGEQFDAAFLRLTNGQAERYLLCVDEFDEIIRIAGEAGESERMKLMGFIHHLVEKTEIPLSLFLTMTRLPEGASRETASPLLAKCEVVELRPFAFTEMSKMVLELIQDQAEFQQAALEWLYCMGGGHPYITKLILANLFQHVVSSGTPFTVNQNMLMRALNDSVDDPRANYAFENIYRVHFNADEKRVVLYLAERNEPVETGELRVAGISSLTAAKNLERRYYLVEHDGDYLFQAQFLGYWLRNWAEFDEEIERLHVHRMVNPWMDGEEAALTDDELHR